MELPFHLNDIFLGHPNWKWINLIASILIYILLRPLLEKTLTYVKKPLLKDHNKWATYFDFFLKSEIENPLAWIISTTIWIEFIRNLQFGGNLEKYFLFIGQVILAIHIIRLIYVSVDALGTMMTRLTQKTTTQLDDQLVPFAIKSLKFIVVALGILICLQNFGFNVMGLLAGLGLGGLALALAAQDTAANVFGSLTIIFDTPFKIGDWIKVNDIEGTVEEIGFRSTRVRTFYNSLITIPNSVIAKEKVDNMGERPRRRVRQVLGLTYETSPELVERFCYELKFLLASEKQIDSDISVAFVNFNASSLDILVQFHLIGITDAKDEQMITQTVFLKILHLAAALKVEFAYNTQTLHVVSRS